MGILETLRGIFTSTSRKEEVVAEYVIREHHSGRSLDEILQDAYVTNRLSPEAVRRIGERPDIIHAVGQDVTVPHTGAAPSAGDSAPADAAPADES